MSDYELGMWDCQANKEAKEGQSDEYYDGYNFRYQLDQISDARTA